MSTELLCLVLNVLWGYAMVVVEITGKTQIAGPRWNQGNRESPREFPAWIGRTGRALANHQENLPMFLVAIVVLELTDQTDGITRVASLVYVVARMAHGLLYMGGVTRARSAAHLTGLACVAALYVSLFW